MNSQQNLDEIIYQLHHGLLGSNIATVIGLIEVMKHEKEQGKRIDNEMLDMLSNEAKELAKKRSDIKKYSRSKFIRAILFSRTFWASVFLFSGFVRLFELMTVTYIATHDYRYFTSAMLISVAMILLGVIGFIIDSIDLYNKYGK